MKDANDETLVQKLEEFYMEIINDDLVIAAIGSIEKESKVHGHFGFILKNGKEWSILNNRWTKGAWKDIFGGLHFEAVKDMPAYKTYVEKPEGKLKMLPEKGLWEGRKRGRRSDLEEGLDAIRNGVSRAEFDDTFTEVAAKYPGFWDRQFLRFSGERPRPHVEVHFGDSSTGKTFQILQRFGRTKVFYAQLVPGRPFAFSGYDPHLHEVIVLDDFSRASRLPHSQLLRLLDDTPIIVEGKGTSLPVKAKTIIITSNFPPTTWYPDKMNQHALLSRIDKCYLYGRHDDGSVSVREFTMPKRAQPPKVTILGHPLTTTDLTSLFPAESDAVTFPYGDVTLLSNPSTITVQTADATVEE